MPASSVTQTSEAAQRYASALFELAQDKGALAAVYKDFRAFADSVRASKDLAKLLDSPAFGPAERKAQTASRHFGPNDITELLKHPRSRHAAFDEDGQVVESSVDGGDPQ